MTHPTIERTELNPAPVSVRRERQVPGSGLGELVFVFAEASNPSRRWEFRVPIYRAGSV
jgi:hypothetical protein